MEGAGSWVARRNGRARGAVLTPPKTQSIVSKVSKPAAVAPFCPPH